MSLSLPIHVTLSLYASLFLSMALSLFLYTYMSLSFSVFLLLSMSASQSISQFKSILVPFTSFWVSMDDQWTFKPILKRLVCVRTQKDWQNFDFCHRPINRIVGLFSLHFCCQESHLINRLAKWVNLLSSWSDWFFLNRPNFGPFYLFSFEKMKKL